MYLGDLRTKESWGISALERLVAAILRSLYEKVSKWAMMFAGCCPALLVGNGDADKLMGAEESMSPEELRRLRRVFDTFDANQDGFLTLEELCEWMKKLGRSITKGGLLKMLQSCDWDNDGRLDFNEFVALTQTLHLHDPSGETLNNEQSPLGSLDGHESDDDPKSEMKEAFELFDKDGNGLISPSELRATLCELGLLSSPGCLSRIHSMIKKVDTDGDGQVSFFEFETMLIGK